MAGVSGTKQLQQIAIIGAGGFAREVLDTLESINEKLPTFDILGYIVDAEFAQPGNYVNDKPILGDFSWLEKHSAEVAVVCGVGAPEIRWRLIARAEAIGASFCQGIIHTSAVVTRWMTIGCGSVITAGCVLSNQLQLGSHVHVNPSATVGHDVVIEDYVSLAPGTLISGNVTLKQGCYVGTGAKIIEKRTVGEWSVIGAGAVVIGDVVPNATVVGVPARVIKIRSAGWHLENSN